MTKPSVESQMMPFSSTIAVLQEVTLPVDAVGLHFCLMRRKVFETLPGPDWFSYPRRKVSAEHRKSEDVAFSEEAQAAGFKLGATSKVATGHYSTIPTGWETHHEWLKANQLVEKFGVDANGAPINPEAYAVANGVNGKHEPVVSV